MFWIRNFQPKAFPKIEFDLPARQPDLFFLSMFIFFNVKGDYARARALAV